LYPAGIWRRIVNGPAFPGSPARTAAFAPAGSEGGASPHFKSAAENMTCSDFATGFSSTAKASEQMAAAAASKITEIVFFIMNSG
jgi:hypothetical protein